MTTVDVDESIILAGGYKPEELVTEMGSVVDDEVVLQVSDSVLRVDLPYKTLFPPVIRYIAHVP